MKLERSPCQELNIIDHSILHSRTGYNYGIKHADAILSSIAITGFFAPNYFMGLRPKTQMAVINITFSMLAGAAGSQFNSKLLCFFGAISTGCCIAIPVTIACIKEFASRTIMSVAGFSFIAAGTLLITDSPFKSVATATATNALFHALIQNDSDEVVHLLSGALIVGTIGYCLGRDDAIRRKVGVLVGCVFLAGHFLASILNHIADETEKSVKHIIVGKPQRKTKRTMRLGLTP